MISPVRNRDRLLRHATSQHYESRLYNKSSLLRIADRDPSGLSPFGLRPQGRRPRDECLFLTG